MPTGATGRTDSASPGEGAARASALVWIAHAGLSLAQWESRGALSRDWLMVRRLGERYPRVIVVSWGGAGDAAVAGALDAGPARVECVCNETGAEASAFAARVPGLVAERLGGADGALVKTDQMWGGLVGVAIARALRARGVRTGLIARGGYPWSRFVAWEDGPGSARAQQAGAEERELCHAADLVVGTTPSMLDDLCWRHGLDPSRTRLVPNYVEVGALPQVASEREPGVVLSVGRLVPQKRMDLLVSAASLLPASLRSGLRLHVVGQGPGERDLRSLAERVGVRLTIEPFLPHAELVERMRRCAVYAQTSAFEGHPKAVLEAMALGAPALVADTPGLGVVVEHGVTGVRAAPEPAALAGALAELLENAGLRDQIGRAAAARVRGELSLERVLPMELEAHALALSRAGSRTGESAPPPVRWDAELLGAGHDEAASAFARSVRGYARRLQPVAHARFLMTLNQRLDEVENLGAMELGAGVHPKHRLMKYHDFFVERVPKGSRVLDLGCGYGAVALSIAERCEASVLGMDVSDESLAKARTAGEKRGLAERVRFQRGDITRAQAEGRFDVVVLSNVLEHLADRPAFLARVGEWYRPSRLLVRVPAIDRDWKTAWKIDLGVDHRSDPTHETEYTEDQLRAELNEGGWRVRELVRRWGELWAQCVPAGRGSGVSVPAGLYRTTRTYADNLSKAQYIADKYAPILRGRVLDVGAGRRFLKDCLPAAATYVALDMKPESDIVADLDAGPLPVETASFDTVLCCDVLEHLERAHAVFDELCRVSRGRVIISLPNPARNFLVNVLGGSGGREHYYGLPVQAPKNRHRWFFGFEEACEFLRGRAQACGWEVEQLDDANSGCVYWIGRDGKDALDHANLQGGDCWCVLRPRAAAGSGPGA